MFVQICICQVSIKNDSIKFLTSSKLLLTLILQLLMSQFFVSVTLRMEFAISITLSQSSIIITCFNHVALKHYSKKVKGVLAV